MGRRDASEAIYGLKDEYLRALVWQCLAEGITNEAEQIQHRWGIVKSGDNGIVKSASATDQPVPVLS